MEFNFNCEEALNCDSQGIAVLEGSYESNIRPSFKLHVKSIIDIIGELSSKEQGLSIIKTNSHKFFTSYDRLFIKVEKNKIVGFLRTGQRKLFLKDDSNNYTNDFPICVIDFFVNRQFERLGHGKQLFDKMIIFEKVKPHELAYDRLTPKMIKFLNKHYLLNSYIIQNNGFVVFTSYFDSRKKEKKGLSTYGEDIINNNNKVSTYKTHNTIKSPINKMFGNLFLQTNSDEDHYENKRKDQLVSDFNDMQRKKDENEFKKFELNRIIVEQGKSNQIIDDIERKLSPKQTKFYEYNKRYDPRTVFDERKTLLNKVIQGNDYTSYYSYQPITVNTYKRKYFNNF